MTIRHLKIFVEVAMCGKMNQAAKKLYISQPSVSQAIQELEKYYGCLLFERLSQKLFLTESGKKLLPYAKHVIASFQQLDYVMRMEGQHPRLQIGASVSVGTCYLVPLIQEMKKRVEGIDIQVLVNNTTKVEEKLLIGELDIGLVEGKVKEKDLLQIPVFEDELVVVIGREHKFYKRKSISLEELDQLGVISREDGSKDRNQFEQLLVQEGITLIPKWICTNTEAIKQAVKSSEHLAILSKMLVKKEVKDGDLRILPIKEVRVKRYIRMIYHRNKYLSPDMETFMELVKREPWE